METHPVHIRRRRDAAGRHTAAPIAPERAATTAKSLRSDRLDGTLREVKREWLTPAEITAELRVSRATVYALIKDGRIRATRVGLSLRVRVEDFAAFLAR
jgi:excisionase family DNA binding protein